MKDKSFIPILVAVVAIVIIVFFATRFGIGLNAGKAYQSNIPRPIVTTTSSLPEPTIETGVATVEQTVVIPDSQIVGLGSNCGPTYDNRCSTGLICGVSPRVSWHRICIYPRSKAFGDYCISDLECGNSRSELICVILPSSPVYKVCRYPRSKVLGDYCESDRECSNGLTCRLIRRDRPGSVYSKSCAR